jgi:hypothetical protein
MIEQIGPYRVLEKLGEGGPPSLTAAFGRSFGEVPPKPNRRGRDD